MSDSKHTLDKSTINELMASAYAYGRHDQKNDAAEGRIGDRWVNSMEFADAVRARRADIGDFDDLYRQLATDTGEVTS